MPAYVPFAIATIDSGVVRNKNAYAIPEQAYTDLENCYVWRGRLKKRLGPRLLGRLSRTFDEVSYFVSGASPWSFNIFTINGFISAVDISAAPTLVITTPSPHGLSNGDNIVISDVVGTTELNGNTYAINNVTATTFEVSQAAPTAYTSGGFWYSDRSVTDESNAAIECGSFEMTIDPLGAPEIITDNGQGTLSGDLGATGTINYQTGAITITGAAAAAATILSYNYFPCLPTMGLNFYETNTINQEDTIAFDTKYSYIFDRGNNRFVQLGGVTWNGDNADFFWASNYWNNANGKLLWVTNFNDTTPDPMRYWDSSAWTDFLPQTDSAGATLLHGGKIIIPYKGRLVILSTLEGGVLPAARTAYPNRARWSQVGDPTVQASAWRSDVRGFGGYSDASTNEHIMSVSFIRDILIVRFERSTWALRYTGNDVLPFVWDRISVEMGADSTFSDVQFDRAIITVGDKGITACDGNFVERIDNDIPQEVFNFHNGNDGPTRVQGLRDFENQLVYWTFPNDDQNETFPNRMLIYNYEQSTWAFFKDSYTALGTHWQVSDITWASLVQSWQVTTQSWDSARSQGDFPLPIGGNQQGFVMILNAKVDNDPSLHITAIARTASNITITSPNHNLENEEWIILDGIVSNPAVGAAQDETLNGRLFQVSDRDANSFQLLEKIKEDITAISLAASAVITFVSHTYQVGDEVLITGVLGMTEINQTSATVTAITSTTITVDIDSTTFTAYTSLGYVQSVTASREKALIANSSYIGCGTIEILSNFKALSKKFNLIEEGSSAFLGYIDFLTNITDKGEISCNIYADYSDPTPVNTDATTFFNSTFETSLNFMSTTNTSKDWSRFFCPLRAQFFQYELTFNNEIMASLQRPKQEVEIGAVVIYAQKGGRLST